MTSKGANNIRTTVESALRGSIIAASEQTMSAYGLDPMQAQANEGDPSEDSTSYPLWCTHLSMLIDTAKISLEMRCSEASARRLASYMMGDEDHGPQPDDEDCASAVGEFANIALGLARRRICRVFTKNLSLEPGLTISIPDTKLLLRPEDAPTAADSDYSSWTLRSGPMTLFCRGSIDIDLDALLDQLRQRSDTPEGASGSKQIMSYLSVFLDICADLPKETLSSEFMVRLYDEVGT